MTVRLPPYATRASVAERLFQIFPEGAPNRNYCTRDIASATVFTLLYVGAVDGRDRYLAPKQIIKMSDEQAAMTSDAARLEYHSESLKPGFTARAKTWYADNSREPVRDETLRQGLIPLGAVVELKNIPTTSPKPRYALGEGFVDLFDPAITDSAFRDAVRAWQAANLSPEGRAKIAFLQAGATKNPDAVIVNFPNGHTLALAAGESSHIAKAVVEAFAPRFLLAPIVVWLSESGNKVVHKHDLLAKRIGLNIDAARNLPDIILADVGEETLIVFVEVVATDGPVTDARRNALMQIARDGGFADRSVAFVTAYMARESPALKKTFATLAWNSFVWFASEPENIISLRAPSAGATRLRSLLAP